ncbi:hypothetical protein U9M48_042600, partial [Paspalum notatum var. saurae]
IAPSRSLLASSANNSATPAWATPSACAPTHLQLSHSSTPLWSPPRSWPATWGSSARFSPPLCSRSQFRTRESVGASLGASAAGLRPSGIPLPPYLRAPSSSAFPAAAPLCSVLAVSGGAPPASSLCPWVSPSPPPPLPLGTTTPKAGVLSNFGYPDP